MLRVSVHAKVAGMTTSILTDAFAHHIWATERLIDVCATLTAEQLAKPSPGTYGSIYETLRHLVRSDGWYLTFFRSDVTEIEPDAAVGLEVLRSMVTSNGAGWRELIAGDLEADADVVERGEGWEFHAPLGLRLAQVVHHGTDHRSQVCTALTSLGVTPSEIDLWDFGRATGRTRDAPAAG
jgi:uncharacterized damage-inducible protein DinB